MGFSEGASTSYAVGQVDDTLVAVGITPQASVGPSTIDVPVHAVPELFAVFDDDVGAEIEAMEEVDILPISGVDDVFDLETGMEFLHEIQLT